MYYRLTDDYALRAWKFVKHAFYHRFSAKPIGLDDASFELLLQCDGEHDLTLSPALDKFVSSGVITPCAKGEAPSEWSRFVKYDHRMVPAMNLMITGKCNYNCRHCFNAADNAEKMTEWDWDSLMDLFDQAAACGIHAVTLTGGEPLIYPRFLDAVREIYKRGMVLEKLTTNGYFLNKEILREFRNLNCDPEIKISFDGVGHHDWMRGHPGAEAKTLDVFRLCAAEGFKTMAQTQVFRGNLDTLHATVDLLDSIGVNTARLIRTTPVPRWKKNMPDGSLAPEEYFKLMLDLAEKYLHGDHRMEVIMWQFLVLYPQEKAFAMVDDVNPDGKWTPTAPVCLNNRSLIAITCERSVVPCIQMADYASYFGFEYDNLRERTLKDIITGGKWHDAVCTNHYKLREKSAECGKCPWFGHCGGGCRALAMLGSVENGGEIDYFANDPFACLFFKGGWYDEVRRRLGEFAYPGSGSKTDQTT